MTIEEYSLYLCNEYNKIFKDELSEDLIIYLLSFENCEDLKEYVSEVIDSKMKGFDEFYELIFQCWKEFHNLSSPKNIIQKTENSISPSTNSISQKSNKKTNFSPLFGSDGKEKTFAKLPGRHSCECQAHKHALVNNCLNCGRVVCEQEGSGPCFFCGSLVCTKEEQEILSRDSKKSDRLRNFLMKKYSRTEEESEVNLKGLDDAIKHKNRLLDYDRTSAKRTQVIDDESDYFATDSNQWLSEKQRAIIKKKEEQLRALRFASRKERKITLDFAGRQVVEEDPNNMDVYVDIDNADVLNTNEMPTDYNINSYDELALAHPDSLKVQPMFVACGTDDSYLLTKHKVNGSKTNISNLRIQDAELQQMADSGMALSMHQPWASLLVAGIKKHEGRSWYSNHRGVLWIASTSKAPNKEEILEMENFYKHFYNDENLKFPKSYPASCLLGRVEVVEVLCAEEYLLRYPSGGESGSPYVFICENAAELKIKFPMKGKHKIYKLEASLLKGARKALIWT